MIKSLKNYFASILNERRAVKRKKNLAGQIHLEEVDHLQVQTNCNHVWMGSSYGGFFIHPDNLNAESVIYSFGIGKDITFDKACIKKFDCHIYGFDPTPKSIDWIASQAPDKKFHFYNFGIAVNSGVQEFFMPVNEKWVSGSLVAHSAINARKSVQVQMKSFEDIARSFGHQKIDVVKMDIEGAEYEVLESILNSAIPVNQILVEFHDRLFEIKPEFRSRQIVSKMNEKGYRIYAASETFEEISFILNK